MQEDERIGHTLSHAPIARSYSTHALIHSLTQMHPTITCSICLHTTCSHMQHTTLALPHMDSHVPMHILTLLHVYTLSHACICSWYRPTQTHSQIPMCLPKMLIYIHACRKRPQKNKPGSTDLATHMATSQRHMDRHKNTQFKTHIQRSTPSLESRQPPKPQSTQRHTKSHTHRARRTHRHRGTHRHSHNLLHSHPQVLPKDSRSWHSPWGGLSRHRQRRPSSPGPAA